MNNFTINKQNFTSILNVVKEKMEHDDKCTKAFQIILPNDFVSGYDNSKLYDQLLNILKIALDDNHKDSWIDYFIYELNFGKDMTESKAWRKDGSVIDLSTISALWNFLNEKK